MQPTTIVPALMLNWYDGVVACALAYGLWAGMRAGLSGEILRVLGLLISVVLALEGYLAVGARLRTITGMAPEPANLCAFAGIAAAVTAAFILVRNIFRRSKRRLVFPAMIENTGGSLAGGLRMVMVMTWVTVILSLIRSPFWHKHVAHESLFGSIVVRQFPSVAAVAQKEYPENFLLFRDLHRPTEPGIETEPQHP